MAAAISPPNGCVQTERLLTPSQIISGSHTPTSRIPATCVRTEKLLTPSKILSGPVRVATRHMPISLIPATRVGFPQNAVHLQPWYIVKDPKELNAIQYAIESQIKRILNFFKRYSYDLEKGEEILEGICALRDLDTAHMAEAIGRLLQESMFDQSEEILRPLMEDVNFRTMFSAMCRKPDFELVWKEILETVNPEELLILIRNVPKEAGHLQRDLALVEKERFPEQFEEQHAKVKFQVNISEEDKQKWHAIVAEPQIVFQNEELWSLLKKCITQACDANFDSPYSQDLSGILSQALPNRELFVRWMEQLRRHPYTRRFAEHFLVLHSLEISEENVENLEFLFDQFGDQSSFLKETICLNIIKKLFARGQIASLRRFLYFREVTIDVLKRARIDIWEDIDVPNQSDSLSFDDMEEALDAMDSTILAKQMVRHILEKVNQQISPIIMDTQHANSSSS